MSNALKFTDKYGKITVFVQVMDHQLVKEEDLKLKQQVKKTMKKQKNFDLDDIIKNKKCIEDLLK